MMRLSYIKAYFQEKIHIFLTLCCVFLLSACAEEVNDCGTIQENMGNGCMLCSFFDVLKNSASKMADNSWNRFAEDLSHIVLIVAAIYVALSVLKMVGAFGKQNVADFLTSDKNGLIIFMFKTAVIWYLLANGLDNILKYLISPLLSSAIDIAGKLSPSSLFEAGSISPSWNSIFDRLSGVVKEFNGEIAVIISIGQTVACVSTIGFFLKWKFLMLIYGSLIFIFGWILMIGISFYLVDIMIRLLFAAVLLPLGIACAVSKLSVSYTKNIWNLFLNVFFSLIILGIMLNITLKIILLCLGQNVVSAGGIKSMSPDMDIVHLINANSIDTLGEMMQGLGYLLLTIVSFSVIFNLIRQMGPLTEKISDTAGFSPASEAMAPFAQSAVANGKKVTNWGSGVVGSAAAQIRHDVARATRLDKLYKWSGYQATRLRGYMTGTGSQGHKAFWRQKK